MSQWHPDCHPGPGCHKGTYFQNVACDIKLSCLQQRQSIKYTVKDRSRWVVGC